MTRERDEIDKIYKSTRWQKVRRIVLIRDNYLCQECLRHGLITPANTVHHNIELRKDISKAFDLNNLESVCSSCHNKEHPDRNSRKKHTKRDDVYKFHSYDGV